MTRRVGFFVAAVLAVGAIPQAQSTQPSGRVADTPQGSIELIAGANGPDARGRLLAALRFRLRDGWHTYWRNPGDSGGPPVIRALTPSVVTASGFDWPTPERISAGPFINYGYHGDVVLPFTLTVPTGTAPAPVTLDVRWLVCKDVCVSVRSSLSMAVPLTPEDGHRSVAWANDIRAALSRVPRPAPPSWKVAAVADGESFVVTLELDRAARHVTFFPIEESQIDDSAPQNVEIRGSRATVRLKKSQQLARPPESLPGIVSLDGQPGFEVSPRVTFSTSSQGRHP